MRSVTERCSNRPRATRCAVLAVLLACACSAVRAQAPSCAWGDGVTLPGGDTRQVLITGDGAAGVLAITWLVSYESSLSFFHVLEQGRLDPSLPADGVTIMTSADLPDRPEFSGVRACSDGVGGAYLLFRACNATTAHVRCYEIAEMRLLHLTPQGTAAPGWPALGIVLPPVAGLPSLVADIVPDAGAGSGTARGVIAAWIDGSSYASPLVYVQRFAPDGTTLWPGGLSGLAVLDGQTSRISLRLASDQAGGATVVATQLASGSSTQLEPRAGRALADGSLPWTTAGKPVVTQPTYSVSAQGLAMNEQGRWFVTLELSPISSGSHRCVTQLLTAAGARAWGLFGIDVGSSNGAAQTGLASASGLVSLHTDVDGMPRFQQQDAFGLASWGDPSEGVAADWTTPPSSQLPLITAEGHVLTVWQSGEGPPDSGIRAQELEESGGVAPGWPPAGAEVCGSLPGHYVSDAMISVGNLFVAFGSDEGSGVLPTVQRLSRAALAADTDVPPVPLALGPPSPNPARGDWTVRLALREPGDVTIEAFDIAGRRALSADLGVLAAGRHVLGVPGGASLAPGVYRIRARTGPRAAERVLVKVR
jgi:hypothetical protein